ncbi:hypothetical protein P9112_014612 [Eukaryota sp. TZLM1-RC]
MFPPWRTPVVHRVVCSTKFDIDIIPYKLNLVLLTSPNNLFLAVGAHIHLYDIHTFNFTHSSILNPYTSPSNHINYITKQALTSSTIAILSVHTNGECNVFLPHTQGFTMTTLQTNDDAWGVTMTTPSVNQSQAEVSQSQPSVFVSNNSHDIFSFNLTTLSTSSLLNFHDHNIPCLDSYEDYLASACIDGHFRLFQHSTSTILNDLKPSSQWGWCVKLLKPKQLCYRLVNQGQSEVSQSQSEVSQSLTDSDLSSEPQVVLPVDSNGLVSDIIQLLAARYTDQDLISQILRRNEIFRADELGSSRQEEFVIDTQVEFLAVYCTMTEFFLINLYNGQYSTITHLYPLAQIFVEHQSLNRLSLVTFLEKLGVILVASQASNVLKVINLGIDSNLEYSFEVGCDVVFDVEAPICGLDSVLVDGYLYRVVVLFLDGSLKILEFTAENFIL